MRPDLDDGFFYGCAPTFPQAKRIWWNDIKKLIPPAFVRRIYEADLIISLTTGVDIGIVGLDKPERMEGNPIDGICIDEFGNVKKKAWDENIRPALDTPGREGWAWMFGVPEGRNHFHTLWKKAAIRKNWGQHHWRSDSFLSPEVIQAAMEDLDERTYEQEYGASFLNFSGRIYYTFEESQNAVYESALPYDDEAPLIICFDFNIEPGSAVMCQEAKPASIKEGSVTLCIDEVHIPVRSNTIEVCQSIVRKFGKHKGQVLCYGDASGGSGGSAQIDGSDWELVRKELRPVFGSRLHFRLPGRNPAEKSRINAVNSRMKPKKGPARILIDGNKCPQLILDFEGVVALEGTDGKIDKRKDLLRTHWSDGFGYYIHKKFPARTVIITEVEVA